MDNYEKKSKRYFEGELEQLSTKLLQFLQRVPFDAFDAGNDPHGEHDFGGIEHKGEEYLWKIDYYDPSLNFGSKDPADPKKTTRVLTLMRSDEY